MNNQPSNRHDFCRPHRTGRMRALMLFCILTMVGLFGCSGEELYADLTERQANEMVAALQAAGIEANKEARDDGFALVTSERNFGAAVRTLNAHGLPRETFDTIGGVFKREGFVSSPLEERARLLYAMSQELSNTLGNIDGVVTARVHLVVPERNPLAESPQPAAASVFIKHLADRDLTADVPQIKALVVNSIEGLAYEHVTVALFAAKNIVTQTPPATTRLMSANVMPMLAGGIAGLLALIFGFGLWLRGPRTAISAREIRQLQRHDRPTDDRENQ